MIQLTTRLKSGEDLREGIDEFLKANQVQAGVIVSLVGNLDKAVLRMAGAKSKKEYDGPLEIVSAAGTLSVHGNHIHIAVADKEGSVFGGHLAKGSVIRNTVELSILKYENLVFKRVLDEKTGFEELVIE